MKVAILNDTHCGIRNSSDVFLDNAEKFYTDVFFPYLLENNIRHIFFEFTKKENQFHFTKIM